MIHSTGIHPVHIPPVHLPNGGAFTAFVDLGGESVDNGSKSERLVVAQTPSFSSTLTSAPTTPPTTSLETTVAPSAPEASPISDESGKMEKLTPEVVLVRLPETHKSLPETRKSLPETRKSLPETHKSLP